MAPSADVSARSASASRGDAACAKQHFDLVAPTREALKLTGRPWVIENVVGALLIDPFVGSAKRDFDGTHDDLSKEGSIVDHNGEGAHVRQGIDG